MQDDNSLMKRGARAGSNGAILASVAVSTVKLANLSALLSAADELTACADGVGMLRLAVELARERLELERVGLYLRARVADRVVLRGTWGTNSDGKTVDERSFCHEISARDCADLVQCRRSGQFGIYRARAPLISTDGGSAMGIGEGWIMATPLVATDRVFGVLYNDAALTHTPVDWGKQAAAAVFCTLLAMLVRAKRPALCWQPWPPVSSPSALIARVLRALETELSSSGDQLARELGVSAGHLARSFKLEMGVSLVDYRNRLRMMRFLEAMQNQDRSVNILDAALQAGFGSYAQFHRICHRMYGSAPRELLGTEPGAANAGPEGGRMHSALL